MKQKNKELELKKLQVEYLKRLKNEYYTLNPLAWLKDRLGEDEKTVKWSDWGEEYENHQWDGDKNPLAESWLALAKGNWIAIESATGTGKTFTAARVALWFLDVFPNSLIVTSAPKKEQLSLNLWKEIRSIYPKFKKLRPEAELLSLRLKADNRPTNLENDPNEDWHIIGFVAGTGSVEESATRAQGFHRPKMLIITEETPGMRRPVMTAFENTCVDPDNNLIYAIGNPDNTSDVLHQFSKMNNVKSFRISAYDHPNVVLKKNVIHGAVTHSSIVNRKDKYGEESNFYKSRVRGISPEQSIDSLIRLEWINKCITYEYETEEFSKSSVGIDVADSEVGDKAAVAYGKNNILLELYEFQCPDASHLAYNLIYNNFELREKNYNSFNIPTIYDYDIQERYIGIDAVGVGTSTLQTLQNNNIKAVGLKGGSLEKALPKDEITAKPLFDFVSLRAQMYWKLREDLRLGNIKIAIKDKTILSQLTDELVVPKFISNNSKITVQSKKEIKKTLGYSPNVSDAVVYWNWIRKGYYAESGMYEYVPLYWGDDEEYNL